MSRAETPEDLNAVIRQHSELLAAQLHSQRESLFPPDDVGWERELHHLVHERSQGLSERRISLRAGPAMCEAWEKVDAITIMAIEGWCVGAMPQAADALATPVNDLERQEDLTGSWRCHVNAQLAGPYRQLFGRIDTLILLRRMALLAWIGSHADTDLAKAHADRFATDTAEMARRYLAR